MYAVQYPGLTRHPETEHIFALHDSLLRNPQEHNNDGLSDAPPALTTPQSYTFPHATVMMPGAGSSPRVSLQVY